MKSDPRLNWRRAVIPVCLVVYRVCLISSPDRLVVIRLVATEFVSSTRETDSSRITPHRLVKCRVRLVELWDQLVVS